MARVEFTGNTLSSPVWAADFLGRDQIMPFGGRVDPDLFSDGSGVTVTATAQANANATSIPVAALSAAIPKNTILYFGTSKLFALLTAAAAAGATSLTVQALPTTIPSGSVAVYSKYGIKAIKSGTLVGRTFAEREANAAFGPAAVTDDEFFLTVFDVVDALNNPDIELLRPGTRVKENFLPEWTTLNTAVPEVQTVTIAGTLSAGAFTFYDPRSGKTSRAVAYNGNLAAIQTALDDIYGASNSVAAGTIASFTITFAVDLAAIDMPPVEVQPDGVTGLTSITVVETTKGGKALLARLREVYQTVTGVA